MAISKTIGGVLLIVGTSIGAGMLALPIATASLGIGHTIMMLIASWLLMTQGALWMLSVNLRLPPGSNIVSMAKSTLGKPGQVAAWFTYLFLLYALLSAYISGGSDVLGGIFNYFHIPLPNTVTSVLFTGFWGLVVYSGIRTVDYVNRGLMFGKLGIFALLVIIIFPHIHIQLWQKGARSSLPDSTMVLVTSFGFASIVPSLRDYFQSDEHLLKRIIWIGSAIPLICYTLWIALISGTVSHIDLEFLMSSGHATSGLTRALNQSLHKPWITGFFSLFNSICMVTAFLCVSLGLFDFLADGLHLTKKGSHGQRLLFLTFGPPLSIVLLYPGIYIQALKYAGVCCVLLLLVLPALMAWRSRTLHNLRKCANNDLF